MREAVAETDDALMEKFFEGEPFTQEELTDGVKNGVKTGAITPVFCGATTLLAGVDQVLWGVKKLLPSAARAAGAEASDRDGNPVEVECTPDAPLCAYVFKTVADPFVGKLSYVKVVAGELKADSSDTECSKPLTYKSIGDEGEQKYCECYNKFYFDTPVAYDGVQVPYLTKYYANTIVGYSYSKSLSLPGERIGYLVIPDEAPVHSFWKQQAIGNNGWIPIILFFEG